MFKKTMLVLLFLCNYSWAQVKPKDQVVNNVGQVTVATRALHASKAVAYGVSGIGAIACGSLAPILIPCCACWVNCMSENEGGSCPSQPGSRCVYPKACSVINGGGPDIVDYSIVSGICCGSIATCCACYKLGYIYCKRAGKNLKQTIGMERN